MAVQTISTTGDIPEVLDPFYTGRPGEGTVGHAWIQSAYYQGCLIGGFAAIFPDDPTTGFGLTGAAAYAQQFAAFN
jgi:hypothetical protein